MKWEITWGRVGSVFTNIYVATGKFGTFKIWSSGKYYHAIYIGDFSNFRFPRKKTLEEMKTLCESNAWWEE